MLNLLTQLALKTVPRPFLSAVVRRLKYGVPDLIDTLRGTRDPLIPPRSLNFVGGGDFKAAGDEFLGYFRSLGGLKPGDAVLDVGSGIGRMARPLTAYLADGGRYEGFDIDLQGVNWCKDNISVRYPNFNFLRADIYNKMYNPGGQYAGSEYRFPYPDNSFDFIFSTSVFTHMFPQDVANYLAEISRVLKPGGRILNTFFLLNEESKKLVAGGHSTLDMKWEMDGFTTVDKVVPEHAISFQEATIAELHARCGLQIARTAYGRWCGRGVSVSYQDMVIAEKLPVV